MTSSIDEQTIHVFIVVFVALVFFFSGIIQVASDTRDPYTAESVSVDKPSFNATTHEPSDTDVLNTSWDNQTIGLNFTIPAGEWTIKGWLGDSGWFSSAPDDYTFTIWESKTVDASRTYQLPTWDFNGEAFNGSLLPRLDTGTSEMRGMFSDAPTVVRWTLIVVPMILVITMIKVFIGLADAVIP